MQHHRYLRGLAALLAVSALAPAELTAQAFPAKPARILVGTPAGGPGDVIGRAAAQVLGAALSQPFVVENRVGADGMIAGEACARAAPDAYTLCLADSFAVSLNPVMRADMQYDPARDLTPVAHFGFLGAAIFASPSLPASSMRELFELARAKPGSISWGSFGLASSSRLYIEWLKKRGIVFYDVPYKAASQAWQALLAGEVQLAVFAAGAGAPFMKSGKVKALAINTPRRSAHMPNVPTFEEAGMEVNILTWFALFAPASTPREIVERLNAALAPLVRDAALRDKYLTPLGIEIDAPAGASPKAIAAFVARERERYAAIVKVTGVKAE
jgi:tripartite-type tricarboxylate transporter receptor subunit TctC